MKHSYLRLREPSKTQNVKTHFPLTIDDDMWRYQTDKKETFILKASRTIQNTNGKTQFPPVTDDDTWRYDIDKKETFILKTSRTIQIQMLKHISHL